MAPIDRSSSEFATLQAYARDTHGATHGFRAQIECAFRVDRLLSFFTSASRDLIRGFRQEETNAWNASPACSRLGDGDRLLLWHGSRSTNFAGILKQGLRIAPPEGEDSRDWRSIPTADIDGQLLLLVSFQTFDVFQGLTTVQATCSERACTSPM